MIWKILLAVVALVVILAARRKYVIYRFQDNAKTGDACLIYIDNLRYAGTIYEASEYTVIVTCMGGLHKRYRSDIYPL